MTELQLGLGDVPDPIYLFVGTDEQGSGWHFFDFESNKSISVPQRALTGYIREIKITMKEFDGNDKPKLDVVIQADRPYVVRAGLDTTFSRGLLLAMRTISDFEQAFIVGVKPGDKKVVFASLYRAPSGDRIQAAWDANTDLFPIVQEIQRRMGAELQTEMPQASEPRQPSSQSVSAFAPAQTSPSGGQQQGPKAPAPVIAGLMRKADEKGFKSKAEVVKFINDCHDTYPWAAAITEVNELTESQAKEIITTLGYV